MAGGRVDGERKERGGRLGEGERGEGQGRLAEAAEAPLSWGAENFSTHNESQLGCLGIILY